MALPKGLVNEANAHVSQALNTGARGQTTTHTDYGVIGDAFFKKAQMDLQIADLQADMGYKKASLLSGLEMQRAGLELESGKLKLSAAQMAEEQRRYEESQEVSDSEKLLGSLSGAVSGAVTGFTVGGPMGAVVGAGVGGLMTYSGYQNGGRQAGQQAQQTLGVISQGATTLKGLHNQAVQEDAWKGVMKSGGDLIAQYNSAQTPQEQYQAMQGLDAHIGEVYQTAMSMPGANPEKVGTMVANYRKGLEASVGMPTNEAARQNQFRQLENTVQYQADPRANDPKQQRAWANDYIRDASAIYEETTGKQMPMSVGMKMAKQMSAQAGRVLEQQVGGGGGSGSFGSMPARQNQQSTTVSPSASQQAPQSFDAPQPDQTPVMAPTPERSLPVGMGGGIPWRPMVASGPGIEMDDMGSFEAISAEHELSEMGAETVKALEKPEMEEPGTEERIASKLKNSGLGFLTSDERIGELQAERQKNYDKKMVEYRKSHPIAAESVQRITEDPNLGEEAVPFFTERDPRTIQEAYDVKNKQLDENDRAKVAGAASAATQMNKLREDLGEMSTADLDRNILMDYQIWKQGEIGEAGMKATSKGVSGGGVGAQWSSFEKSVRQSLEGKGIKGRAADKQIQLLRRIDSQVDPIAQSLAVAKQGSRPSDADVQAYKGQLVNLMDPNAENSIVGLDELQTITYRDFQSALNLMPSRSEFLQRKAEEGRAGRMTPAEKAAGRAPTKRGRYVNDFFEL